MITSRQAGYEPAWFNGFAVLEMTELSLPQAKLFVARWFGEGQKAHSKSLQELLEKSERLQLLVTNPLMLAIVCFVYGCKHSETFLPNRRVDLYERCIDALTTEWDKSRGVDRQPIFTPRQIETVLRYVAYEALIMEKIDFSRKELLSLIRTHMPKAELRQFDDETFLQEVLEHTGLFKEKASDMIGFIHLTFQEYLAAQVIAEKVLHGAQMKDVKAGIVDILRNIANPRWVEPISLAAGILRGRKELFMELFEVYKAQPNPDSQFKLLLASCLRDADLSNFASNSEDLIAQDEILSELVMISHMQELVR